VEIGEKQRHRIFVLLLALLFLTTLGNLSNQGVSGISLSGAAKVVVIRTIELNSSYPVGTAFDYDLGNNENIEYQIIVSHLGDSNYSVIYLIDTDPDPELINTNGTKIIEEIENDGVVAFTRTYGMIQPNEIIVDTYFQKHGCGGWIIDDCNLVQIRNIKLYNNTFHMKNESTTIEVTLQITDGGDPIKGFLNINPNTKAFYATSISIFIGILVVFFILNERRGKRKRRLKD
jgi:hypothetical protein